MSTRSGPEYINSRKIRLLKWFGIPLLSALVPIFFNLEQLLQPGGGKLYLQIFSSNLVFVSAIWLGNEYIMTLLSRYYPWQSRSRRRLLMQLLLSTLYSALIELVQYYFICISLGWHRFDINEMAMGVFVTVVIALFFNAVYAGYFFFRQWNETRVLAEQFKREQLQSEFEALKNQVNPHFLFNSLNTLTSLIEERSEDATRFVHQLASVYRYVLTQRDKETVALKDELDFVNAYVFLNQVRFGENLQVRIEVPEHKLQRHMVTLTLQMLVENAIKHNIISRDKPLHITIGVEENKLYVSNNLQPKTIVKGSNGVGLSNISYRYAYLAPEPVEVLRNEQVFRVDVPLLDMPKQSELL